MLGQYLNWRFLLVLVAIAIVSATIWFSNKLANHLRLEERKKMEVYAQATESLANTESEVDINLASTIISSNTTIPAIITDEKNNILSSINFEPTKSQTIQNYLAQFKTENKPIEVIINGKIANMVYFGNSYLLRQLKYFPYILFAVIAVFLGILFIAVESANRALQNRVWVGMSKETAHQLGTPISSLIGWVELLKANGKNETAAEMEKDISRLKLITDRFSKIGSVPELTEENVIDRIQEMVNYMKLRAPKNISINFDNKNISHLPLLLNGPLFDWVIENLMRNAIDSLNGKGNIYVDIYNRSVEVIIDVKDDGKGIDKKNIKKVFKPGFTTKKRGWGLGLSLSKRIIEKYHKGKIYVLHSDAKNGTVFRIEMKKS